MNTLLEELHDIEGLDLISRWPLAPGWWVLMISGIILSAGLGWFIASRIAFKRSWKSDTLRKLSILEEKLSETTGREVIITLSEYLRRIALRRFSRKECASLTGETWLAWLTQNDPKEFDWKGKGTLLTDIPYARSCPSLSPDQIKELIKAVKEWVR